VTLLNRCYQIALWCAFQALRVVWFVRRPNQHGALVLVWFEGRVLLIRNSYQPRWSAPGGSVELGESAFEAATREVDEEIGIQIGADDLRFVREVTFHFRFRNDRISLFEWHPTKIPSVLMDKREIVEARWFDLNETRRLWLLPHLDDYFGKLARPPDVIRA